MRIQRRRSEPWSGRPPDHGAAATPPALGREWAMASTRSAP